MPNIKSTYRIQFHKEFTFKSLSKLVDYFADLGISTIYASPIFTAIPGSTHGYDGTNPLQINPEIGTEDELVALSKKLKEKGINWLQDIVPNHMAFHPNNAWLMDVLENWKNSPYFDFFDLDFPTPMEDQRLMVPFLGGSLADAINDKQISVTLNNGKIFIDQSGSLWPVNEQSLSLLSKDFDSKENFEKAIESTDQKKIEGLIADLNNDKIRLTNFVDAQFYQLCPWQLTQTQLNYRRFFTVNALICLKMEHQHVFDSYHQYIFELVEKGIFQGLRIDHIDGLADPKTYLERLRKKIGPEIYLSVEKILGPDEEIPDNWPIEGNTGYDFLAMVNNLLTNRKAENPLSKLYHEVTAKKVKVNEQIFTKKREILTQHMQGELNHLYEVFKSSGAMPTKEREETTDEDWKFIIGEFLIRCPVYRFYPSKLPLTDTEIDELKEIIDGIPATGNQLKAKDRFEKMMTTDASSTANEGIFTFLRRCMQFSGPLMAKGVEDTLMYTYNRFIGHTEVGDSLEVFGLSVNEFNDKMSHRFEKTPLSLNATATHDTKRGEDVRARLNVLTDMPTEWGQVVNELYDLTLGNDNSDLGIHRNDAYLIFQTIFGAIPFLPAQQNNLEERLTQFVEKALREAKKRSDWGDPDQDYEDRAKRFITSLVDPKQPSFKVLETFLTKCSDFAILNSLAQITLKCTCPGVPDFYQGSELWDLSLVDPDNRRPVDFSIREKWLQDVKQKPSISDLWQNRLDGKIKLWLTNSLIEIRKNHLELFEKGNYVPLKISGAYKNNLIAFLRQKGDESLLTVIPLGLAAIADHDRDPSTFDWKDTSIQLPQHGTAIGENLLTGTNIKAAKNGQIKISELFESLPLALIHFPPLNLVRGSGILMHITSLPSRFEIGDLGPGAHDFINILAKAEQKYWQLLPLNPTDAKSCHSPYCAFSAMAGSPLLISPETLIAHGLLTEKDLPKKKVNASTVNYTNAEKDKSALLQLAFDRFSANEDHELHASFEKFCKLEVDWLDDFALFAFLRNKYNGEPWTKWPVPYRDREENAMREIVEQSNNELTAIKFQQFIFEEQWKELKTAAHRHGIKLIGDLPFYVAHNSADVWANRQFFELDENAEMKTIAGVPADAFSADGQRWGMPIFNWGALSADDYSWWVKRIRKNIELFDLVRLDHFRAFHTYWQSLASEETAASGWWTPGPGKSFFKTMEKELGRLPFIAEDLGSEMEEPIEFRKELGLPGMRVVQFAFGEDLPHSPHIPHQFTESNSVVYTGTHDNNTVPGWYKDELDPASKSRLSAYLGYDVDLQNVHEALIKLAFSSTSAIAIIQMQDLLGLGSEARMNTPGTEGENWGWRMENDALQDSSVGWLKEVTMRYGR